MIRLLSDFVVRTSESLPRFLLALLLGPATLFLVLFPIMRAFTALTSGLQPFDWQDDLTAAALADQLPAYTEPVRQLYYAHAFVDFIFPVYVAAFFGAIAAWALRHGVPAWYQRATALGLFALYFVSVPFDYAENTGSLMAILGAPDAPGAWAGLVVAAKKAKLPLESVIPGATGLALVVAAGGWLVRRIANR